MEIMPSEYQHLDLCRSEKIFVRNIISNDEYGYLLLKTNPAMLPNESMHVLVCSDGILFLKFFEEMNDLAKFELLMPVYIENIYKQTASIITEKLISNMALVDDDKQLKFPVNIVYAFPALMRNDVEQRGDEDLKSFVRDNCIFKDDLSQIRTNLEAVTARLLSHYIAKVAGQRMKITDENINSILQRIAPEYVTIRMSLVADEDTKAGVDSELLVVTENDTAVKAFRLDAEQINIVNKINKGDQLILACAGSGKSVLLIAKCFKAAAMNPDKRFLITCYNKNLYSLYTWFIDRAGLKARNVECLTFHKLCRRLLVKNGFSAGSDIDLYPEKAISKFNSGHIKERFYGIFIDEVQQFDTEWYKFCYNLLENKDSNDHLFVICGDKTQKLANLQKHGRAPWNAGEGYPNYRGGNKSIRIERNYRNCIEINEFINRYVSCAKQYLHLIQPTTEIDPDEFLRGQSVFHGKGVTIKHLEDKTNNGEAKAVAESIKEIHDKEGIPYDEIAVIMFNKSYRKNFDWWNDKTYNIEKPLMLLLSQEEIPYCTMYGTDESWGAQYGDDGGVRLIGFQTVLGLDFRAAIVCGLVPLGEYNKTRKPDWTLIKDNNELFIETLNHAKDDIRFLYVACTRAKEILHVILPETGETSVYCKMLEDAE